MRLRKIPGTDLEVSPLGLGTVGLGRDWDLKYPTPQRLPTDADVSQLLGKAQELGINLLDTAPAYGVSEERLGRCLKGCRRHWVVCTKVGEESSPDGSSFDFRPSTIRKTVDRSLLRLGLAELDIILLHSDGKDLQRLGALDVLADLKQAGKVRAIGMSTKSVEGGLAAVSRSDVIMVTYRPDHTEEQAVLDEATGHTGVFIKKALGSGRHTSPREIGAAFVLAFSHPATTSVIIGTTRVAHLRENVEAAERALLGGSA